VLNALILSFIEGSLPIFNCYFASFAGTGWQ